MLIRNQSKRQKHSIKTKKNDSCPQIRTHYNGIIKNMPKQCIALYSRDMNLSQKASQS